MHELTLSSPFYLVVLTESGKAALKTFIDNGGALVSIHSGCAALYTTDFFAKAVGANFDYHPKISTPVSSGCWKLVDLKCFRTDSGVNPSRRRSSQSTVHIPPPGIYLTDGRSRVSFNNVKVRFGR